MKMQAGDTPATRRLHLLAGHIAPSCSMQGCAAHSRVQFARPASTDAAFARSMKQEGDEKMCAAAMQAAHNVLAPPGPRPAPTLSNAASHQASPSFARPAEDVRMANVTSNAMNAFEDCASSVQGPDRQAATKRAASLTPLQAASDKRMRQGGPAAGYALDVALPGVRPGDMVVEVGGGVLTVRGPRAAMVAELRAPLRVTRGGRAPWRRLSGGSLLRGSGRNTFQAQWPLPAGADEARVSAEYDHGILRVRLATTRASA